MRTQLDAQIAQALDLLVDRHCVVVCGTSSVHIVVGVGWSTPGHHSAAWRRTRVRCAVAACPKPISDLHHHRLNVLQPPSLIALARAVNDPGGGIEARGEGGM